MRPSKKPMHPSTEHPQAVGIAALTLIGTALGRLDVPLGGSGGVVVMLAIAAVGWVPGSCGGASRRAIQTPTR
jgi:hypothetical protein